MTPIYKREQEREITQEAQFRIRSPPGSASLPKCFKKSALIKDCTLLVLDLSAGGKKE